MRAAGSPSRTLQLGRLAVELLASKFEVLEALDRRYGSYLREGRGDLSLELIHRRGEGTGTQLSVADRYGFDTRVDGMSVTIDSAVAQASMDLSSGLGVVALDFDQRASEYYLENILRQVFQLLAIRRDAFLVHAAGVVPVRGAGQLFAGKSGAGKSTISRLLGELGFEVLSDDLMLVDSFGVVPQLCATPFFGTFRPAVVGPAVRELGAINFLEQAPEPKAASVESGVAVAMLLSNVPFADCLDTDHRRRLIEIASLVTRRVEVRRLAFRRDPSFLPLTGWPPPQDEGCPQDEGSFQQQSRSAGTGFPMKEFA